MFTDSAFFTASVKIVQTVNLEVSRRLLQQSLDGQGDLPEPDDRNPAAPGGRPVA
jgi:hypothetical protein